MIFFEPCDDIGAEFAGEIPEFVGFGLADGACGIVFSGVALGAAGIKVVGIILALVSKDERQGGEGAVVGEVFLGSEAAGVKQDGAEFERGIVGDAELPIRRKIAHGVLQIAFHDREKTGDLGRGGLVG